jgi:hypothetical protein
VYPPSLDLSTYFLVSPVVTCFTPSLLCIERNLSYVHSTIDWMSPTFIHSVSTFRCHCFVFCSFFYYDKCAACLSSMFKFLLHLSKQASNKYCFIYVNFFWLLRSYVEVSIFVPYKSRNMLK